jgi:NAD(P)-dependent dehydrogenase (short-subunit alcohol dehydrogenase family)
VNTVQELMDLKGRRALITGATGGLGSVMADTLAEMGADLILVDRPGTDLAPLAASLQERWGVQVCYYHCDLEYNDQRLGLLEQIEKEHETINILINNAAFVGASDLKGWVTSFKDQTVETWRQALEVNLTAPFHLCQGLAPLLKNSVGANIINIGSIYGESGPDWRLYEGTSMGNPAAYGASKGGLIQLTRWLSTTLAPNIRVNAISPGGIFRNQPDVFVERYESRTPLERMATEDDFRGAVAYLASDMSSYVTGQNMMIDGGWGVW